MSLPGIDIQFTNGALGSVAPSPDGLLALVCNAAPVASTFELNTPYLVTSMEDVAALGIVDDVNNHIVFKTLSEFFAEAGTGTNLWLFAVERDTVLSDVFKPGVGGVVPVQYLLDTANGAIRGIFTAFNPDGSFISDIEDGIESEVTELVTAAQAFSESYTDTHKAPFFVLTEAYGFDGDITTLKDWTTSEFNRVGLVIGDTEERTGTFESQGAAIGVVAGRVASIQVHVNMGKVRDGALRPLKMYMLDDEINTVNLGAIHDKGYITFRSHVGRSGYFISDDNLATLVSDDYRFLARRRVIDKAFRVAYGAILDFLLDDFDTNVDGTISNVYAKSMEGRVVQALFNTMTVNGELSRDQADANDFGAIAEIDLEHNVIATSTIKLKGLQVKPKGYGKFIEVPLGFVPVTN